MSIPRADLKIVYANPAGYRVDYRGVRIQEIHSSFPNHDPLHFQKEAAQLVEDIVNDVPIDLDIVDRIVKIRDGKKI